MAKPDIGLLACILPALRTKIAEPIKVVGVVFRTNASTSQSRPAAIGRTSGIQLAKQCIRLLPKQSLEARIVGIDLMRCCALFWRAKAEKLIIAGKGLLALLGKGFELAIALLVIANGLIIPLLKSFVRSLFRALECFPSARAREILKYAQLSLLFIQ